jgi:hypothetical protein
MMFGRMDEQDDELDDDGPEVTTEEAPVYLSLHHHILLTFGGRADDGLMHLTLPTVSAELTRNRTPARTMPVWMPPLLNPDALRLLLPPGVTSAPGIPKSAPEPFATRLPFPSVQPVSQSAPAAASTAVSSATETMSFTIAQPEAGPSWGDRVDPLVAFLFYLALGAGIALSGIDQATRYIVLWTVLITLGAALTLVDAADAESLSSNGLLWGFGIGLIFGIIGLVAAWQGLAATVGALFPDTGLPILFQSLVLIAPIAETLFFRSAIQDRRGVLASIVAASANNILFFLPIMVGADGSPVLGIAGIVFLTILAGVYSAIRRGYGLSAALMCQITVNLLLLFIPGVIVWFNFITRTP